MKSRLFILIAALGMAACSPHDADTYTIKGEVKGLNGEAYVVFLDQRMMWVDEVDVDTLKFENGRVRFRGQVRQREFATILYPDDDGRLNALCMFFKEPGKLKIEGDMSGTAEWEHAAVTGTANNDGYVEFYNIKKRFGAGPEANTVEREAAEVKLRDASQAFISRNADNAAGIYALFTVQRTMPLARIRELSAGFPEKYHNIRSYLQLQDQIEKRTRNEELLAGRTYDNTQLITPDGGSVELTSVTKPGKYTLIEFWTAASLPNHGQRGGLRYIYEKYGPMGLDMVGVSLDEGMGEWLNGLEAQQIPWRQFLSPRKPGGIEALYDVERLPRYVLLAPGGDVVATSGSAGVMQLRVSRVFD